MCHLTYANASIKLVKCFTNGRLFKVCIPFLWSFISIRFFFLAWAGVWESVFVVCTAGLKSYKLVYYCSKIGKMIKTKVCHLQLCWNSKIVSLRNDTKTFIHFTENKHRKNNNQHSNELINNICVYIFVAELLNLQFICSRFSIILQKCELLSVWMARFHIFECLEFSLSIYRPAAAAANVCNATAWKFVYNSMNSYFVCSAKIMTVGRKMKFSKDNSTFGFTTNE